MEVIYALYDDKQFVNRGFLMGPYCPIYGCGSVLIIYLLKDSMSDPLGLYLKAILIAAILEYGTSFLMEKIFHARWWDYSDNKWNINGRICLETLIPFGFLACFAVYFVNPFIYQCLLKIDIEVLNVILILFSTILIIDTFFSFKAIYGMRNMIHQVALDSTIEVKEKLKEKMDNRRDKVVKKLERLLSVRDGEKIGGRIRILKAFPNIQVDLDNIRNQIELKKQKRKKKSK